MTDSIPDVLAQITHAVRRKWAADALLAEHQLSVTQAGALAFVGRHANPTQQELVNSSGRDKGQVARVLKQLEERQLIERTADDNDRRIQQIQLTSAGKRIFSRLRRRRRELGQSMLGDLSTEEQEQLGCLLRKLQASLDS